VSQVQAQVPLILSESENIRKDLPAIAESVDKAAQSVQSFTDEMGKVRPMVPEILDEVRQTRKKIPEMLDQAERIASQGQQFGSEAGRGVVSGLISVFNPITITRQLRDLVLPGKDIKGLTSKDIELIREKTLEIVETGSPGTVAEWENAKSGNYGKFSVVREFAEDATDCKEIKTEIWINDEQSHDFNVVFCQRKDGSWIKKETPALDR